MAIGARLPHLWERQADRELLSRPDNQSLIVYGGHILWSESDVFVNLFKNVTALATRQVDTLIDDQLENVGWRRDLTAMSNEQLYAESGYRQRYIQSCRALSRAIYKRQYDQAEELLVDARESCLNPAFHNGPDAGLEDFEFADGLMALTKYPEARSFIRSLPPVSHHPFWKHNAGPELGWRRLLVAECQIAEGDYQSAADELEKPIPELFVKNTIRAELQVALAKAYLGLGKSAKAMKTLEQAFLSGELDHEFFDLYSE